MKYFKRSFLILWTAFIATLFFSSFSYGEGSAGINFAKGTLGALGDYKAVVKAWEFEVDTQAQRSKTLSLVTNASVQHNFGSLGLKPFVSYSRDGIGNIFDGGGVLNFALGGLDIAAGASFRGANPAATPLEKRFDANDNEVEVHDEGYSPNAYQMPATTNVNLVILTGFEKWRTETDLTVYTPITEREIVPTVVISKTQTSLVIPFFRQLSANFVLDARTYLHKDGIEVSFTPFGGVVYRFR